MNYTLPVSGVFKSGFGARSAPKPGASTDHKGIDFAVPIGTSVVASLPGVVTSTGYTSIRGNYIALDHGGGITSIYQHLQSYGVSKGQSVAQGQKIALSGNSGLSTGPHLHWEMAKDGKPFDPMRDTEAVGVLGSGALDFVKKNWIVISIGVFAVSVLWR